MASISKIANADGSTSYRVRVVTGHRPDGTPIQRMRTFRKAKEAEAAARGWETDRDRGLSVDHGKARMGDYLNGWKDRATKRVRPSTFAGYRYLLDRYIMPALGGKLLRDLTPSTVQAWIDSLPTPDTAHRCRRLLHIILEDAVRLNLLATNPTDRTTTPPKPPSAAMAWSADDAKRFLAVAATGVYHPYWQLALRLVLRPSELLGLTWDGVDLDAGTLTVRLGRATVANASFEGAPKSIAGNRVLDLPANVVLLLRAHKARQNARRLQLGELWHDNNLVCAAEAGQPISHRNLTRAFKGLCAAAGVVPIRLYDLRHTAISLMAERGADIKAISEVAGHANVLITRNVYQHINRAQRAAALDTLDGALEEGGGDPNSAVS